MSAKYYGLTDKKTPELLLLDTTTGQLEIYETKEQAECFSNKYAGIEVTEIFVAKRIGELEQQNAELVAHIEDSKHVMMAVANCDTKEAANVIADKWIEQTPQQSLANMQKRIDELTAMLELSRKAYECLQSGDRETYNQSAKWIGKFLAGHKSVPLNNIKADAIEKAVNLHTQEFNMGMICFSDSLLDYTKQLREQEK